MLGAPASPSKDPLGDLAAAHATIKALIAR
jgi:hypothetical protein